MSLKQIGRFGGRWLLNNIISLDQLLNSLCFGDPDETISSRIGRIKRKWGGKIPPFRPVTRAVDYVLEKFDRNHSIDAIEEGEGSDGLLDKPEL